MIGTHFNSRWLKGTVPPMSYSTIEEQLLHRNVKRFRGGLVFKAHRLLYHFSLGLRVIKKKKKSPRCVKPAALPDI